MDKILEKNQKSIESKIVKLNDNKYEIVKPINLKSLNKIESSKFIQNKNLQKFNRKRSHSVAGNRSPSSKIVFPVFKFLPEIKASGEKSNESSLIRFHPELRFFNEKINFDSKNALVKYSAKDDIDFNRGLRNRIQSDWRNRLWPNIVDRNFPNNLNQRYNYSKRPFNAGGYGDVWLAKKIIGNNEKNIPLYDTNLYVLKRLNYSNEKSIFLSARREIHFGLKLSDGPHITRFIESFNDPQNGIIWLVFLHEGDSLKSKLYDAENSQRLLPSRKWCRMKRDGSIAILLRELAQQMLKAVAFCHEKRVLHRDVKPGNILINRNGLLRLADFGCAVDSDLASMYGAKGPMREDTSLDYAPPEVLFSDFPFSVQCPYSYDLWSIGVVMLEIILGRPDVFRISNRDEAIIKIKLRKYSATYKEKVCKFKAFCEYGILTENNEKTVKISNFDVVPNNINENFMHSEKLFKKKLKKLDFTGIGFDDQFGINFILQLLKWESSERRSAKELLKHAFFKGPLICFVCGAQFALEREFAQHKEKNECIAKSNLLLMAD